MSEVEIKAGPKLDRAVAKAIGITHAAIGVNLFISSRDWDEMRGIEHPTCEGDVACHPFQPSTDLNAAFAAAEKVRLFDFSDGSWCVPCKVRDRVTDKRSWRIQRHTYGECVFDWETDHYATPALAICAAILALEAEKPA